MDLLYRCAALDLLIGEIASAIEEDTSIARLLDAAQRVRARVDLLRSHLEGVLSDRERLADAAGRAYWHVNGFVKARLAAADDFVLRLHIWPAGENRRGDTEPHSHRWDFASWIAVGEGLSETYFTEVPIDALDGDLHARYVYSRRDAGDGSLLRGNGVARLRGGSKERRTTDAVYGCHHTAIHTVAPVGDDLLATVLLQGPKAASTVVYRPYKHLHFPVLERPIAPDELADLLEQVTAALGVGATAGA